jgi:hypothetical protein
MRMSKKTLARLTSLAHLCIALVLCDVVPNLLARLLLLVSAGVIGCAQSFCILHVQFSKDA